MNSKINVFRLFYRAKDFKSGDFVPVCDDAVVCDRQDYVYYAGYTLCVICSRCENPTYETVISQFSEYTDLVSITLVNDVCCFLGVQPYEIVSSYRDFVYLIDALCYCISSERLEYYLLDSVLDELRVYIPYRRF